MEQFGMSRQLRLPGQQKDRFWRAGGLCALTAAVFFLPFYIMDGGFFHYAGDFNSQQISFYRYMNGFLKGAGYPDSTFAGAPHNTFSWATDLGSGAMNAYSFYLYGSPFFWFSLLFPQRWLPYLMVPLLVLKFGVAGGGAFLYLRRYVKNIDYAVLGACLYTFSGFTVYNVFFNHFVDVVALFPYLLWSLDEALYNDRRSWFAFWVAVNLVNNYFFFIGQVVFLAIYFICKLSAGDFRLTAKKFGLLAFESLLGVAMGSILLVPAVLSILQNPRTIDLSSGWGFLTYSKVQQYLAILVSWIMPPDSPYLTSIWSEGVIKWTSMSAYLPLCSLAGAVAYWKAKCGDSKKRIVGTCAVFALVPILNSAFYALNSSYYARWYYMPVLVLAAMTVNALEDHNTDLDSPARGISWLMIATVAFAVVPVQDSDTGSWSFGVLKNPGQYCAVLGFGLLGLLLACVGQDKMYAVQRLTFGSRNLLAGIDMIPVLIGLFAVTEVFKQTDPKKKRLSAEDGVSGGKVNTKMPSLKELWSIKWTMIRCSVVGTVVGILPGAGATIASFMCYTMETKLSKHPEKFGTGIIDGIAASEASNNAATGGAMVPLLSLGIPGGNAAAVMMSALTLKGVQLGPLLLTNQPTYLSATFMSMIVTNILMVIVAMAIAKVFAQILAIPYSYLGPIILMLALIGTYGDQMSATSVQIMVLAGILGLVVRACHLNSAAIVLGLVLGSMCEQNFSRGYLMARANVLQMFNPALHPIAFVLIIVCIVMLISPMVMSMRKKKDAK